MRKFNEANTIEAFVRDLICGIGEKSANGRIEGYQVREPQARYGATAPDWKFLATDDLPRQPQEALVEKHLRGALTRLNHTIAAQPDRRRRRASPSAGYHHGSP